LMPLLRFGYGLNIRRRRIGSLSVVSRFKMRHPRPLSLLMVNFASTCLSVKAQRDSEFVEVEELAHVRIFVVRVGSKLSRRRCRGASLL
jgi:hypothetical protein